MILYLDKCREIAMGVVANILATMFSRVDFEITIELDEIVYSKKHGHHICIMHLIGKNSFPKMTAAEILATPKAMAGLSQDDLIAITRLDMEIKQNKTTMNVVEIDCNGMVVLEDRQHGKKRYSDMLISSDPGIMDQLKGRNAFGIGYRLGFKEGFKSSQKKQALVTKFLSIFRFRHHKS